MEKYNKANYFVKVFMYFAICQCFPLIENKINWRENL